MRSRLLIAAVATALLAGTAVAMETHAPVIEGQTAAEEQVPSFKAEYAWNLATTAGTIRTSGVLLSWDRHGKELFVVDSGVVRVFSPSGMEIFSFGDDAQLGNVSGVTALDDGNLLLLSWFGNDIKVVRTNFRGELLGMFELSGLPANVAADFRPNAIFYAGGKVFLASKAAMQLVVTDLSGAVIRYQDLAELIGVAEQRSILGIRGFSVDAAGNVLFTIQPLFRAYVVREDGRVESFGTKGSVPGKFNVIGPIGADDQGNFYVGDLLRSTVQVFDKDFRFVKQIGRRGEKAGEFVVPNDLAVGDGMVFVSQNAGHGVSVFRVARAN